MDSGNVSQLLVPHTLPVEQRKHIYGQEREAEFLSLRLLNKRGRVRLSSQGIDCSRLPGKSSLFAVGNRKGWFAAAVRKEDGNNQIVVSTLSELRAAFETGRADPEPFIPFAPKRSISVPGTPIIVKFALDDERLVAGFLEGPILVYDTNDIFTSDEGSQPDPIYWEDASTVPRDILPNPGESPELVAVMRSTNRPGPGHQIDIVDLRQLKHVAGWRGEDGTDVVPVSISWSPRGKQIAIGLQSGDMLLYSPLSTGSPKSHLLKPPSVPSDTSSLLATTWLSNPTFHTVFSSPEAYSTSSDPSTFPASTQMHFISMHDSKSKSAVDIELRDPCPPFGARRPPGPLSVVLRNWSPTKFLIFCGDGPAADIGVVGTLPSRSEPSEEEWVNFTLEETSTPSLPLDENMDDTALLALEIDLTSTKPVRMSEQPDDGTPDLPPSPILFAYTSDGTLIAWHVLNSNGEAYPGMTMSSEIATGPRLMADPSPLQQKDSPQVLRMPSPRVSPASPTRAPAFPPTQASTPLAFGQAAPTPSSTASPASGFGSFGSVNTTLNFESAGFGFGTSTSPSKFGQAFATPAFGSTGFGSSDTSPAEADKSKPTLSPAFGTTGFGQTGATPTFGASGFGSKPATPAFGQSGFGSLPAGSSKPTGFGTASSGGFASFASQGTSAFGSPVNPSSSSGSTSAPTSAFEIGGFGQATSPSAPQSAFGAGGQGQAKASAASPFGIVGIGQAQKITPSASPFGQQQEPAPTFAMFGQKATTPAFGVTGSGNAPTSAVSQSGGFGGFGALGDALNPSTPPVGLDSPPGSPPSPEESPPGSPELRPSSRPTKPASSYVKPAGGFGAYIKPAEGFTAFRGATKPPSSFIKPAAGFGFSSREKPATPAFPQQKPASPAFGSTAFGSLPTFSTNVATPTFGATSALGRNKPVFGTSSFGSVPQPAVSEPSKPITGGFGSFSSGRGDFASFANTGKPASFADILGSEGQVKPKPDITPLAFSDIPKTPDAPALETLNQRNPSPIPEEKSAGMFTARGEGEASKKQVSKEVLASHEFPRTAGKHVDPSFGLLPPKDPILQAASASASPTPAASEQAKFVGHEIDAEENDQDLKEGDGDETASEPFSLTDDGTGESEPEDSEQQPRSHSRSLPEEEPEPSRIPLPRTPETETPRLTPTPTPEAREVMPKVEPSSLTPEPPVTASSPDDSTTPPGSPEKLAVQSILAAPVAPKPVLAPSASSPFGFGLGRPSSRPIRSSPLASTPITSGDDEESAPDMTSSKPAEANASVERTPPVLLPAGTSSAKSEDTSKPHRPKTPPLLGTSSSIQPPPSSSPFVLDHQQTVPVPSKAPGPSLRPPVVAPMVGPFLHPVPDDEEIPKSPMQVEFLRAYQEMIKEFVQLHKKAQEMAIIRPVISEPRGLPKLLANSQEFVSGKYSHGDLKAFATMIGTLQQKVVPLLEQGSVNKRRMQDLQNLALISETKLEEVSRWVRAREDPDFAKTLKPHTLGPEHSENQIRLRTAVQVVRDRVQQCEDEIESLKKRLGQHKSGKAGIRPPSLDTIDRTCRNIQLALEERIKLLEQLHDRIETLSPKASRRLQASRGHPGSAVSSCASVTPPFASVAAAALNSERSSLKLKDALLSARREPLFTTKVSKLESPKLHQRLSPPREVQRPEWKLPPVPPLNTTLGSSASSSPSVSRRAGRTGKRHGAVQLKATPNAKSVAFDWGPLPGAVPMEKLSTDVRRNASGSAKPVVGDDTEWDQEAEEDYKDHR